MGLPNPFRTLQTFEANGASHPFYSLPALEAAGLDVRRLPVSIRIVLESVLRNCDGRRVSEAAVKALADWKAKAERTEEIPFVVARIVLQDFTGVPLLVDLAAMRSAVAQARARTRRSSSRWCRWTWWWTIPCRWILPATPTRCGAIWRWSSRATASATSFSNGACRRSTPSRSCRPGIGIVHQVNLEYPRQGRAGGAGRRGLSRHAGRHRFAHDDDQRPGHRRLGRGRHRGRGGHARPAGLFPDARRGRRASDRRDRAKA